MLFIYINCAFCLKGNTYGYSTKKIPKYNEDLDRGVVVINSKKNVAFISWRFLITDDDDISFNIYREDVSSHTIEKLNNEPISDVTNYKDTTRDIAKEYNYFVGSVVSSVEVENSTKYTLKSNTPVAPFYRVPIRPGCPIKIVWPGDLNGDGKFDFVLARMCSTTQTIEAYLHNGTFLWEINLGHNSDNHDIFRPSATTVNYGHFDGVNVYDLDGDGKSEVFIRIANNVTFGDGSVFWNEGHDENYKYLDSDQWMAVIDGMTGTLKAKTPLYNPYIEHGPMPGRFGIGYLDGVRPSLVSVMLNRDDRRKFHFLIASYSFNDNNEFVMNWCWDRKDTDKCDEGHQTRIADVNFDGKDEVLEIGFALNGEDGSLRYDMGKNGIIHGDRFYVGRYDVNDDTMMGYGVQQDNPENVSEYYYNASSGDVVWRHYADHQVDNGRGNIGDFDPRYPGLEVFSFYGMYNAKTNEMVAEDTTPLWPANNIYWDGTLIPACYHKTTINKWDYKKNNTDRLLTAYKVYHDIYGVDPTVDETYPLFHGDIIGDWREEFIISTPDWDQLVIFTTDFDTDIKLTSLSQDPGMRSSMSLNGYKQTHMSLMYMANDMDIKKERNYLKSYLARRALKSDPDETVISSDKDDHTESTENAPKSSDINEIDNSSEKADSTESSQTADQIESNGQTESIDPNEPNDSNKKDKGLSPGAIAAIVVVVVVVVVAAVVGVVIFMRKKKTKEGSDTMLEM